MEEQADKGGRQRGEVSGCFWHYSELFCVGTFNRGKDSVHQFRGRAKSLIEVMGGLNFPLATLGESRKVRIRFANSRKIVDIWVSILAHEGGWFSYCNKKWDLNL